MENGGGDFIIPKKRNARKPFYFERVDEIRKEVEQEEKRLQELEERRKELDQTLTHMSILIDQERELCRKDIDEALALRAEACAECVKKAEKPPIDIWSLDKERIRKQIKAFSTPTRDETADMAVENFDLRHIKSNLDLYKCEISVAKDKELNNNKRRATLKMFKQQLMDMEKQCNQSLEKIDCAKGEIKELDDNCGKKCWLEQPSQESNVLNSEFDQ